MIYLYLQSQKIALIFCTTELSATLWQEDPETRSIYCPITCENLSNVERVDVNFVKKTEFCQKLLANLEGNETNRFTFQDKKRERELLKQLLLVTWHGNE